MDWDRMMINTRRSGTFVGSGTKDEDAYFQFFADETEGLSANKALTLLRDVIGNLRIVCARHLVIR